MLRQKRLRDSLSCLDDVPCAPDLPAMKRSSPSRAWTYCVKCQPPQGLMRRITSHTSLGGKEMFSQKGELTFHALG